MNKFFVLLGLLLSLPAPLWSEGVTIHRDEYGVPHIFANSAEGVAFGAGYAQAEDRLTELLKNYLRAEGRLAEVVGGDNALRSDYLARLFQHAEVSQRRYHTLDSQVRSALEAFQEGVKLFMSEHPRAVPEWAPELHPWQVVALGRYIIWGWPLGEAFGDLGRAGIQLDQLPYRGSNQWLVGPQRTSLGVPIALIDPHLSWYDQFRFYECRLYGGRLEFSGSVIVGTPFLGLGHNRYLSIAMTTGGPDTSDVYEEQLNPENRLQYKYDDSWRDMTVRRERIGIREGENLSWVEVEMVSTHHGPILSRRGDKAYAVAIPYAEEVGIHDQTYRMITSRDLEEMKAALRMLQVMAQNIMVGTVQGDIYYLRNGRVPIRPPGFDFSRPVPGNRSATEWQGIHPLSDLIQITNPPQGYMQNCNIAPAFMMKDSPFSSAKYQGPAYLYDENENLHQRAAMVLDLLHGNPRMDNKTATAIALSTQVYKARRWQDRLKKAGKPQPAPLARFYDQIVNWNGRSDPDSVGALSYHYWKLSLGKAIARLVDPLEAPRGSLAPANLREAVAKGAAQLEAAFGGHNVPYGKMFRVGRRGGAEDYPVGGGTLRDTAMATPRAIGFRRRDNHTLIGTQGQTATQVVILTNPPQSFTASPLGQSDHRDSGHWDDQARKLFSTAHLRPTYFLARQELLKHVTVTKRLRWDD